MTDFNKVSPHILTSAPIVNFRRIQSSRTKEDPLILKARGCTSADNLRTKMG